VGLLCAFGWWSLGLNIGTLLSMSIGLVSEKRSEKNIDGNPKNIHGRFNGESPL
jgi:hypothetical protein